jgi:hypothetical protein
MTATPWRPKRRGLTCPTEGGHAEARPSSQPINGTDPSTLSPSLTTVEKLLNVCDTYERTASNFEGGNFSIEKFVKLAPADTEQICGLGGADGQGGNIIYVHQYSPALSQYPECAAGEVELIGAGIREVR